jgi:cytoskeletal protein RodZ
MANSLGEKLRQARESRGISISEVAEQTRISSLYLEGIEADDYRTLPGGIFNKGFVKSYAKHVGVDEQEALQDYARLLSSQDSSADDDPKVYRPEVLTDDRSNSSSLLTIIFAIIILGLITWGAYTFANYYGENSSKVESPKPTPNTENVAANNSSATNNSSAGNSNSAPEQPSVAPNEIKIELKALTDNTSVSYALDGQKRSQLVTPETPLNLEVKDSVLLSYSKYQSANVQMMINGKQISLPSNPENPARQAIDIVITKDNIGKIIQSGAIAFEAITNTNVNANTATANANSKSQ